MTTLPPPPHTPWTLWNWIGGASTLLALFAGFLYSGLKDWIKTYIWDWVFKKREKEIQTKKEQAVTNGEFESFKSTTAARMDELGRVVHASATNMSDSATETRETLRLFDLKADGKLGDVYEKVNQTREDVARLDQKVQDMPDVIVGKILQILRPQ